MTTTRATIDKFWALASSGKSAALDINTRTGELAVRCTISADGVEGNGTPPEPMTHEWARIMVSNKGSVAHT